MPEKTVRIGVDLGGTKIEGRAFDRDGVELERVRVATPAGDYEGTLRAIRDVVLALEEKTGARGTVGMGIPGTVVPSTGLVKNANSTVLIGKPLPKDLSALLGREVRCANDANCLAVSEATDGTAAGMRVVFGVILGTGCGGGVFVDRAVHGGPNGVGGEWGHIPLPRPTAEEWPGPECYCGHRGCMEQWVSGPALERDYAGLAGKHLTGAQIVAASEAGDVHAQTAMDRWYDRVARGLAVIVDVLDPDAIVVGGGLSQIEGLYTEVPERLKSLTFGGGFETPMLRAKHGDASGVRGAAWLWPLR